MSIEIESFTAQELQKAKLPFPIRQVTYHGVTAKFKLPIGLHSGDAILIVQHYPYRNAISPPAEFYHIHDGDRSRRRICINSFPMTRFEPYGSFCVRIGGVDHELGIPVKFFSLDNNGLQIRAIKSPNMSKILEEFAVA